MALQDEWGSMLRLIHDAPESRILDREFRPKERIRLRELETNGLLRVLSYGFDIYWTITRKGIEAIDVE